MIPTTEVFRPASFRRLVPAPGTEMPAPGTRIVAGDLVDEAEVEDARATVVQLTGRIR